MIYNISYPNFYTGLQEWDQLKIVNVIFNIVIVLVGPILLYSVVWCHCYKTFYAVGGKQPY
jgi:hypothetical protein